MKRFPFLGAARRVAPARRLTPEVTPEEFELRHQLADELRELLDRTTRNLEMPDSTRWLAQCVDAWLRLDQKKLQRLLKAVS
jgi:hypothetical protein